NARAQRPGLVIEDLPDTGSRSDLGHGIDNGLLVERPRPLIFDEDIGRPVILVAVQRVDGRGEVASEVTTGQHRPSTGHRPLLSTDFLIGAECVIDFACRTGCPLASDRRSCRVPIDAHDLSCSMRNRFSSTCLGPLTSMVPDSPSASKRALSRARVRTSIPMGLPSASAAVAASASMVTASGTSGRNFARIALCSLADI